MQFNKEFFLNINILNKVILYTNIHPLVIKKKNYTEISFWTVHHTYHIFIASSL